MRLKVGDRKQKAWEEEMHVYKYYVKGQKWPYMETTKQK
jgi:hypothetical protein